MDHAYSLLEVKSLDRDERVIRGIASTPTLDRVGDSVDPMGARFKMPMPLFMHHDSRLVVGSVTFAKPDAKGIPFEARIPKIEEPGTLKDRVDEAWQSVKYKLITAVSIGFRPIAGAIEQIKGGGVRFKEWEWLELSLVPVPANAEATIQTIKSLDQETLRASSGAPQRGPVLLVPSPAFRDQKAAAVARGAVLLHSRK